jgi:hypothetical protein
MNAELSNVNLLEALGINRSFRPKASLLEGDDDRVEGDLLPVHLDLQVDLEQREGQLLHLANDVVSEAATLRSVQKSEA